MTWADRQIPLSSARAARRAFSIDLRSLSAFRWSLGVVLLADIGSRTGSVHAHHTDSGVLPLDLLRGAAHGWRFSIHAMVGDAWIWILVAAAAALAAMFVAGLLTRIATVGSWLLLISLQSRNGMLLNAGDQLFGLLLFWSMFLPLGARWSVDAYRRGPREAPGRPALSIATVAIMLQVAAVYFVSALLKTGKEWQSDGSALYYALSCRYLTWPTAEYLLPYTGVLKLLSHATYWLELIGPLIIFVPIWTARIRLVVVPVFMLFHLGIACLMNIGPFPFICMAGWLVFVPGQFWDWITGVNRRAASESAVVNSDTSPYLGWIGRLLAGAAVAYVIVWNIGTLWPSLQLPRSFKSIGVALRLDQSWTMFAPYPTKRDGWTVAVGKLDGGKTVDLLRPGHDFEWIPPQDYTEIFPSYRWRKYHSNLWRYRNPRHCKAYAEYLWREWDAAHAAGPTLKGVEVFYAYRVVLPDHKFSPTKIIRLASIHTPGTGRETPR